MEEELRHRGANGGVMQINYLEGDATDPAGNDAKILVHICNDVGAWGKGFVLAISKRWKEPERQFKEWHKSQSDHELGQVQFIRVRPDLEVANLIGQVGLRSRKGVPPIRYKAVEAGLSRVAEHALSGGASVHMPRIGCGLAGGEWDRIETLINATLGARGVRVTVYDF